MLDSKPARNMSHQGSFPVQFTPYTVLAVLAFIFRSTLKLELNAEAPRVSIMKTPQQTQVELRELQPTRHPNFRLVFR